MAVRPAGRQDRKRRGRDESPRKIVDMIDYLVHYPLVWPSDYVAQLSPARDRFLDVDTEDLCHAAFSSHVGLDTTPATENNPANSIMP